MLGAGYLFWFLFGGEMYLVLLINQKDYEHIKKRGQKKHDGSGKLGRGTWFVNGES